MKTDAQLETDVYLAIRMCPYLQSDNVTMGVRDGVVTLSGQVHSLKEKWAAEEAVWGVVGVRGMAVNLDVNLLNVNVINDTELARHVVALIDMIHHAHPYSIDVQVENGELTLKGHVDWQYQIQHLLDMLRQVRGIRAIHCHLHIRPGMQAKDVKGRLEAAIRRLLHEACGAINVSVNDGRIVISGYVTSRVHREAVVELAWAIPGVTSVEDHLVIDPFVTPCIPVAQGVA